MRIIGGVHKGKRIDVVKGLPVRPTTDFAKEALFNILENKLDLNEINVLDLFGGTGNIAFEFASRGAKVTCVDEHAGCVRFINDTAKKMNLPLITQRSDVFKFLNNHHEKYKIIFADPPYDLKNIEVIHSLVFGNALLQENGWLIIEHGPKTKLEMFSNFIEHRKYGNVNFSFFYPNEKCII